MAWERPLRNATAHRACQREHTRPDGGRACRQAAPFAEQLRVAINEAQLTVALDAQRASANVTLRKAPLEPLKG